MEVYSNKFSKIQEPVRETRDFPSGPVPVELPEDRLIQTANISGTDISKITILHTGDMHGHIRQFMENGAQIGGLDNIASAINGERGMNPGNSLLLDSGDITTGSPLSDHFKAIPMIEAMNVIGYDAMAMGNHEIDNGAEAFRNVIDRANFPVLSANLVDREEGSSKLNVKPYIFKDVAGVKVGILGLTTTDTGKMLQSSDKDRLSFMNAEKTAEKMIPEMKRNGAQLILVLSHLGIDGDMELARKVGGIDVIIGGHSHTDMFGPIQEGKTWIHHAGSFGRELGRIDISLIPSGNKDGRVQILEIHGSTIRINPERIKADGNVGRIVNKYAGQLDAVMNKKIGTAVVDLDQKDYHLFKTESRLTNFVTDAMKDSLETDVCLIGQSGLRSNIPKGEITKGHIHEVFPWDEKMAVISMSGDDILEAMEQMLSGPGVGIGVSGLKVEIDTSKPKGKRVLKATTSRGALISGSRKFKVATRAYYADGNLGLTAFTRNEKREDTVQDFRDILENHIEKKKNIYASTDGRLVNRDTRYEHTLSPDDDAKA